MRPHRFAPVSLVFGLLFLALGLTTLLGDVNVWRFDWFWPVVLLVAGALVLLSARPDPRDHDTAAAADAEDSPPP